MSPNFPPNILPKAPQNIRTIKTLVANSIVNSASVNSVSFHSSGNYLLDYPIMSLEKDKFIWKGSTTGSMKILVPRDQINLTAIYEIQNIGLGHAMKISLNTNDSEYAYRAHLKIEETLLFIINIASLKRESPPTQQ